MSLEAGQKQKKKILFVDGDESFRNALKGLLELAGYEVIATGTQRNSQNIVGVEDFDAVVSNVRLPDGNGIELLHYVRRTKPVPVILMSTSNELAERKEVYELGAAYFLPKPFQKEELLSALKQVLTDPQSLKEAALDTQFCKLSISDFVSGKELQYDMYVRLSENKYVKIAYQGEDLSMDRLRGYQSKGIRYLYMRKEDFRKYVGFSANLSRALQATKAMAKERKLQFLRHSGELVMEQLHLDGVSEESFENAATVMESTLAVITDSNDVMSMLSMLSNHTDFLYAHSLGVSIHSAMIAKAVGWRSPLILFKVTMGGLLHDIGKKEIPIELLAKPRTQLTPAEVKFIESHTLRGAEILSQVPSMPSDIIQIAAQHHENCLGLGYPAGLKARFIHPMARLVAVANEFCNLAIRGPHSEGMTPKEAIEKLAFLHMDTLDPVFFKGLTVAYGLKPPAEYEEALRRKHQHQE